MTKFTSYIPIFFEFPNLGTQEKNLVESGYEIGISHQLETK